MSVYLNECPICGDKAELIHAYDDRIPHAARDAYYCECPKCGKSTDEFLTEEEAVNAWNNSSATDLKDTNDRIIRSVILKPVKTWFQTATRIFLILLGPVVLYFLLASSNYDLAWWLWATYGILLILWLSFLISFYVKYAALRNGLISHFPKENRAGNYFAIVMGYVTAILVHGALFLFVLKPFIYDILHSLPTEWSNLPQG